MTFPHTPQIDACTATHRCDLVGGQWGDDPELEYVFISGCGHATKDCHGYTVTLYDQVTTTTWKEVSSIWVDGESPNPSKAEALLAAQEGRLVFSGIQYHCVTMDKKKSCDYWGKDKN